MSVLKRRSNNIKDGQYVIAFSDTDRCLFVHLNHLCSATHNTLTFSEKLYSNATTIEANI